MKTSIKLLFFYGTLQVISSIECPEIVNSSIWGGRRIRSGPPMSTPVRYVVIHHTGTSRCTARGDCARIIRSVLNGNRNEGWSKIAIEGFSFIVGGDGVVYKVRGWDTKGAHAPEYNDRSLGIALIGRFENHSPSREQLRATKKLIECGIQRRKLRRDHRIIGHLQISSTSCPGNILYETIKEWPNWYSIPEDVEDTDIDY